MTANPGDGDATACEYTAAATNCATDFDSTDETTCSAVGCRVTAAIEEVTYVPQEYPCQIPHGLYSCTDPDGGTTCAPHNADAATCEAQSDASGAACVYGPATMPTPGTYFNEKVEAASQAECETLPTGNTWQEDACPWVKTTEKDGNGHIRSGTGVAEACCKTIVYRFARLPALFLKKASLLQTRSTRRRSPTRSSKTSSGMPAVSGRRTTTSSKTEATAP